MKIAVIGAGVMGAGIAQVAAQCEKVTSVALCDMTSALAESGYGKLRKALERLVIKEKITEEKKDAILGKVTPGLVESAYDADVVIEAIIERMEEKKKLFSILDANCGPECVFATNTSSLSITEMGSGLSHSLIGMHFFNPAPVMGLVEVIEGMNTSQEQREAILQLASDFGKTAVEVKEAPGFVVNRILILMINEAIQICSEGIASAEDIDRAMKLGANHPMGPLALGDLIGLDVVLAIMETLYRETADSKYRPALLLKKMVRAKKLGRKTGEGFFKY